MNTIFLSISIAALAISVLALFLAVISLAKAKKLRNNQEILFSGKEAKDLESVILQHSDQIKAVDGEIQELFEISNRINNLAFRGIHKTGFLRFNPFKDIGGDQSFAIALLDGRNNGIVISSLHTREGTRVYSKPVTKGTSEKYTLTEEEKRAINEAMTAQPKKL